MRKVYGERGYINFTPVPNTNVYPDKTIRLTIDIDEGKQFRIGEMRVLGTSQSIANEIVRAFPRKGTAYNSAELEAAFNEIRPKIPVELRLKFEELIEIRKHEPEGVVDLTLHLEQTN